MKRSVFLPIVLCVLLILPVFAAESAEQPDFGTLTAAEQAYNKVAGTIQRIKEQYENNSNHSGHSSDPDSVSSEAR